MYTHIHVYDKIRICLFLLQYPLKEVVAIHSDPVALEDIKSLQKYIKEVSIVGFGSLLDFESLA